MREFCRQIFIGWIGAIVVIVVLWASVVAWENIAHPATRTEGVSHDAPGEYSVTVEVCTTYVPLSFNSDRNREEWGWPYDSTGSPVKIYERVIDTVYVWSDTTVGTR